mmetsp:Transcript_22117/g.35579  ORF Transcript_22117/g.35579 Transcript_22117/m.35579 type:complete len:182 (-) Transcript_22117:188-733(-)
MAGDEGEAGLTAPEAKTETADVKKDKLVQIEFAPVEELKASTVCCCCMQSFYTSWPAMCGVQQEIQCICCESQTSCKCLQHGVAENRVCSRSKSFSTCIDTSMEEFICLESGSEFVLCFCLKGASTLWCGFKDLRPCAGKGNVLCCDCRFGIPPGDETVPFGIAICGKALHPKDYKGGSMQ